MKCLLFSIALSVSLFASSYENKLLEVCQKTQNFLTEKKYPKDLWPQDVKNFLEKDSRSLDQGEKAYLVFYPEGSGFDQLAKDSRSFLKVGEFKALASSLGYKVTLLEAKRHMAGFKSIEELESFFQKHFSTVLDVEKCNRICFLGDENHSITFPTKICFVELEKL